MITRTLFVIAIVFTCACEPKKPAPAEEVPPAGAPTGDTDPPADPEPETPNLASSANSITVTALPGRTDPESGAASAAISKITWKDARGADRSVQLWGHLYQYDFSYVGGVANDAAAVTTRVADDAAAGHSGFGYVVSHDVNNLTSPLGKDFPPTVVTSTAFAGAHHALHHVELVYNRGGGGGHNIKIPVVIEWLVATGRDHPVWSVTWKMGSAENPEGTNLDAYAMDSRGPYGSLNFDGTVSPVDTIGGVAWGESSYLFTTTSAGLSMQSTWTYDTPNTVNFTRTWMKTANAEMGIVQTKPGDVSMGYQDGVVGRHQGKTSANYAYDCMDGRGAYAMPCYNLWPYQLMNYDWGGGDLARETQTKLIAWGTPYGWLGSSNYNRFDYSPGDGRGDRAYSTFIVLGPKCRYAGAVCSQKGDVELVVDQVNALASATLVATKGTANGYDATFGVYSLDAAVGEVAFTFTPAAAVTNPIFVIKNVAASASLPSITVDGAARTVNTGAADSGAFVSHRADKNELWVTLTGVFAAATSISVSP